MSIFILFFCHFLATKISQKNTQFEFQTLKAINCYVYHKVCSKDASESLAGYVSQKGVQPETIMNSSKKKRKIVNKRATLKGI